MRGNLATSPGAGHPISPLKGEAPGQTPSGCHENRCKADSFPDAAAHRPAWGVEPDIPELQLERRVGKESGCAADVVVVDVADDGEVDRRRPSAFRGIAFKRSSRVGRHSAGPVSMRSRQVRRRTGQEISRQSPQPAGSASKVIAGMLIADVQMSGDPRAERLTSARPFVGRPPTQKSPYRHSPGLSLPLQSGQVYSLAQNQTQAERDRRD